MQLRLELSLEMEAQMGYRNQLLKKFPFTFATFIFALISVFFLTGCESLQMLNLDDSQMGEMGTEAFDKIKSETPTETNPITNRYVKCVANAILEVVDDPTGVKEWEVVVFRSADVNAFALPGGKIGVFTGLLSVATTQDQLAAVLGHEVAHVTKRHGKQRVQQQVIAQGGLSILEGVIGDNEMLMAAVGVGAQYGVLLPFSRAHESEADLVGLDYLAKAGFNPQGAVQLWQNMEAAGGGKAPEMLSTHPSGSTRIKDLQSKMTKALQTQAIAKNMGKNPQCK